MLKEKIILIVLSFLAVTNAMSQKVIEKNDKNDNVDVENNCITYSPFSVIKISNIDVLNIKTCINTDEKNVNIMTSVFNKEISNLFFEIGETFHSSHNSQYVNIEFWTKCDNKCCKMWGNISSYTNANFDSDYICINDITDKVKRYLF